MNEIIVGISGINAVDNPGPGVGIARSLKEDPDLSVKIVGLAYDAMEPGIYMDWLIDRAYILPYPSGGCDGFIQRIDFIKKSYGLDFILPCLDLELPVYTRHADRFHAMGIRTFLPSPEQFKLRGKDRLSKVAPKIGIHYPDSRTVASFDELSAAIGDIGLPVMVKGAYYCAFRAATAQEAVGYYNRIVAEWGYPVIVQQVITGEEMNVCGVGDGEGGSLGMVGIKKMGITAQGKIWTGVTIRNERMLAAASAFIREYNWRGPFELECIVNEDKVYLIEINPRFPAWSYFATGVGINLPANMLKKVFSLPVPEISGYASGKLFIRYTYEVICDMAPFQAMITKGER